jgi:NAD(P)-dependent dehydrogenase (short-subunit alcohol dehydrogenase family)
LGRAAADLLSLRGYRVFGTSRRLAEASLAWEMLPLDVRCEESVRACVAEVVRRAGRIDVLVNNAGYGVLGAAEEVSVERVKEQFETNFFGAVRMTQAVLPVMRRQLQGRIVNVSSVAGQIGVPGQAAYCATKFAMEGYTESLLFEVERFGIEVCLVEPGFFRTEIDRNFVAGDRPLAAYDGVRDAVRTALLAALEAAPLPERFAERLARILAAPRLRLRYAVTDGPPWIVWCKRLLPMDLFARGVRWWYRIGRWRWMPQLAEARRVLRRQVEGENAY